MNKNNFLNKLDFFNKSNLRIVVPSVITGLVIGLIFGGIISHRYYQQAKELNWRLETTRAQLETLEEKESMTAALYFIKETNDEAFLVPERRKIPYNSEPYQTAVKELISGPEDKNLQRVFPRGTRVLSLEAQDGLAVVNLNKEVTRISRGAWGEALTVSALVNTLTKFPEIDQVRILIEGEEVETLSGHVDLTNPLRRNEQVIKLSPKE